MKDTYYFSHDYNTRTDVKIKRIIAKHGMLGYGVFWAIIEDLYNNANVLPTDYESIAFDLRTNEMLVKSIINDFDLFIIDDNVFGSMSVQRRLDERNQKTIKARESANKRWEKKNNNANALQPQSDSNAIKESKVNKNKANEIDFDKFLEYWNKSFKDSKVPKLNSISPERRIIVNKLLKRYNKDDINVVISKCLKSNFLIGLETDWKISFDWLFKPLNFAKVLEGNYDVDKKNNLLLAPKAPTRTEEQLEYDRIKMKVNNG
jgi:superfamily II helicase